MSSCIFPFLRGAGVFAVFFFALLAFFAGEDLLLRPFPFSANILSDLAIGLSSVAAFLGLFFRRLMA
jgi:hypothetical protein